MYIYVCVYYPPAPFRGPSGCEGYVCNCIPTVFCYLFCNYLFFQSTSLQLPVCSLPVCQSDSRSLQTGVGICDFEQSTGPGDHHSTTTWVCSLTFSVHLTLKTNLLGTFLLQNKPSRYIFFKSNLLGIFTLQNRPSRYISSKINPLGTSFPEINLLGVSVWKSTFSVRISFYTIKGDSSQLRSQPVNSCPLTEGPAAGAKP